MGIHPTPAESQTAVEASSRYVTRASGLVVLDTYASDDTAPSRRRRLRSVAGRVATVILYALVLMVVSVETGSLLSAFVAIGEFVGAVLMHREFIAMGRPQRAEADAGGEHAPRFCGRCGKSCGSTLK